MTEAGLILGPGQMRGCHDSSSLGDERFDLSEKP
jgi:hypothetical protein